jgi:hypothetical protein
MEMGIACEKKKTLRVLTVNTANRMVGPVKNIKHSLLC